MQPDKIRIPKLKNKTRTAWQVNNFRSSITKFATSMCLLKGIYTLRFRSCLQLNEEWRQKSPEGYTTPTDRWEEKEGRRGSAVRQVPERCWRAGEETWHSPERCRQRDASLSSIKASFAAPSPPYTVSGISTSRSAILLFCPAQPHPIPAHSEALLYPSVHILAQVGATVL